MSHRRWVFLACAVVASATAWYAGAQFDPPAPTAVGTVRLGPEPGETVAAYLARLPADLPPPGVEVAALVQLRAEATADEVAALVDVPVVSAVFHVPLPRVQTALRFVALAPAPLPGALATARDGAQFQASADAARRTGRPGAVAATEAAALADPACRCVLALVVRADRTALVALAARPGVRAVQAAPAGAGSTELALAPLLPEQVERADPVPDDGPVPPPDAAAHR